MEVVETSAKLSKILNSDRLIIKTYGRQHGQRVIQRREELIEAEDLAEIATVPPPRFHDLHGVREGQFAVDVSPNFRMIFEAYDENDEQTTKRQLARTILVLEIEDYH